jgi:hypothetical protein
MRGRSANVKAFDVVRMFVLVVGLVQRSESYGSQPEPRPHEAETPRQGQAIQTYDFRARDAYDASPVASDGLSTAGPVTCAVLAQYNDRVDERTPCLSARSLLCFARGAAIDINTELLALE